MFFTSAGRLVAFGAIALGVAEIGWAMTIAPAVDPDLGFWDQVGKPEFRASNAEAAKGTYHIALGVVVGVMTDISRTLGSNRKIDRGPNEQ